MGVAFRFPTGILCLSRLPGGPLLFMGPRNRSAFWTCIWLPNWRFKQTRFSGRRTFLNIVVFGQARNPSRQYPSVLPHLASGIHRAFAESPRLVAFAA